MFKLKKNPLNKDYYKFLEILEPYYSQKGIEKTERSQELDFDIKNYKNDDF